MNWEINKYPIKELATGETLHLKTYTAIGADAGPHIHIQASVHGAELQGNAVILKLMEFLNSHPLKGSITFIPLANPYATNNKHGTYTYGRYNPVTGHNWNRNYIDIIKASNFDLKSFAKNNRDLSWPEIKENFKRTLGDIITQYQEKLVEEKQLSENNKLNLILQKLAHNADGILDLHTGPVATRYLYSAEYEEKVSHFLKFKHILLIPDAFDGAMDEACFIPWVHLRDELKSLGKEIQLDVEAFTLEFGSEETFSMDDATKDVESIINFLKYKGVLEGDPSRIEDHTCKLENYKTIYSPTGGLVDYHFSPGDYYAEGDTLATFYNIAHIDPNDPIRSSQSLVTAMSSGIIINRCPSSSVHQGMELFQVMTNVKKLS